MREASSRTIAAELVLRGAKVQAFDPVANETARRAMEEDLAAFRQDVQARAAKAAAWYRELQ